MTPTNSDLREESDTMSNPPLDPPDDHNEYEDEECPVCGGEGFIFSCFDGFCADADIGCDDCTQPCPECSIPEAA